MLRYFVTIRTPNLFRENDIMKYILGIQYFLNHGNKCMVLNIFAFIFSVRFQGQALTTHMMSLDFVCQLFSYLMMMMVVQL